MPLPSKPCKWCGSDRHWPYQCRLNPKLKVSAKIKVFVPPMIRQLRQMADKEWTKAKKLWFRDHPYDSFACYICGKPLPKDETTLDHIKPKSSHIKLKYDQANLQPCCWTCNTLKGSKSLAYYMAERDKQGLHVSDYARELTKRLESV